MPIPFLELGGWAGDTSVGCCGVQPTGIGGRGPGGVFKIDFSLLLSPSEGDLLYGIPHLYRPASLGLLLGLDLGVFFLNVEKETIKKSFFKQRFSEMFLKTFLKKFFKKRKKKRFKKTLLKKRFLKKRFEKT